MKKKLLSLDTMKEQVIEKAYPILCSTGVIFGGMVGNVCYADTTTNVMNKIKDLVYKIFKYIGFILVIWGVGQLILAFKNEDSDSKSRAALFGFSTFADSLGLTL